MGLPFTPESIESAATRYWLAVKDVVDVRDVINSGGAGSPGKNRKHVFDFEDGLRMIVSRDRLSSDKVILHVSGSMRDGDGGVVCEPNLNKLQSVVQCRLSALSGSVVDLELIHMSGGFIPHWMVVNVA